MNPVLRRALDRLDKEEIAKARQDELAALRATRELIDEEISRVVDEYKLVCVVPRAALLEALVDAPLKQASRDAWREWLRANPGVPPLRGAPR